MTGKKIERKITMRTLTELLCTLTVLLYPMVATAVLSMLQALLTEADGLSGGWGVCCMLLTVLAWLGAAVVTKTRLFGRPMPKTGLLLAGMLFFSVLFYTLAFVMENEVIGFSPAVWAMGRLFGAPAAVSAYGIETLLQAEPGTAAMLSCGVYLAVSFAAALPVGKRK